MKPYFRNKNFESKRLLLYNYSTSSYACAIILKGIKNAYSIHTNDKNLIIT
jgi:hypothetical protein